MAFFLPAMAALSAAGSIYGATKTSKTAQTKSEVIEDPEAKRLRQTMGTLAGMRLSGFTTPNEQQQLNAVDAMGANNLATGMRTIQNSPVVGSGNADNMYTKMYEAQLANRIGQNLAVKNKFYDEAYNTAMQIGMKSPPKGQINTAPNPDRAALGAGGGQMLGQAMGLAFGGSPTTATPAPVSTPASVAPTVITPQTADTVTQLQKDPRFQLRTGVK